MTARFDLTSFWDLKVEGHFIDGNSAGVNDRGFYTVDNPNGFLPNTRLLVVRMGFHL